MRDPFERQLGRPARRKAEPAMIPRVLIGDVTFTGTALEVTRYRDYTGRLIVQVELVDGIAL